MADLDGSTPNVARMYDYYLGGTANFAADREAAERVLNLVPALRGSVRTNRAFLTRAVRYLVASGIEQFLDIGAGLPTQGTVHQVAHESNPRVRVAYADYDPVVVSHGEALLTPQDRSIMMRGDLRSPEELLASPALRAHLDLGKPVAVVMLAVLHFLSDADDPGAVVTAFRDAMAPGSYLVISHVSGDFFADQATVDRAVAVYEQANERIWPRGRDEILAYFGGFELVNPGLVPSHEWRPVAGETHPASIGWSGVGLRH